MHPRTFDWRRLQFDVVYLGMHSDHETLLLSRYENLSVLDNSSFLNTCKSNS